MLYHHGATYLSIHFKEFDFDDGCKMKIRGEENGIEDEGILVGKGRDNLGTFWAHHIKGHTMIIVVECNTNDQKAYFETDFYAFGLDNGVESNTNRNLRTTSSFVFPSTERELKVCREEDQRNAQCYMSEYPTVYDRSRAVARLVMDGIK